MTHSVILKVGENLIYQYSALEKPTPGGSISSVEYNRAMPEWDNTAKNFLIKKEDVSGFQEFLAKEGISQNGVAVPFEDVLIYADGLTNYAKYNKGGENNGIQVVQVKQNVVSQAPKPTETVIVKQETKKEHKFYIEVAIDDESGEPYIIFKNDAPPNSMESKIMKAFILKAKKDTGIMLEHSDGITINIVLC
jgi:hypothetical protein